MHIAAAKTRHFEFAKNYQCGDAPDCPLDIVRVPEDRGTPEDLAKAARNLEIFKALMAAGADVNARDKGDWTALHFAAANNENPEIIKALVAAGADVNAANKGKDTPLFLALKHRNPEVVKAIIAAGADVNAKDKEEFTPLHIAAPGNSNLEVIKALLGPVPT